MACDLWYVYGSQCLQVELTGTTPYKAVFRPVYTLILGKLPIGQTVIAESTQHYVRTTDWDSSLRPTVLSPFPLVELRLSTTRTPCCEGLGANVLAAAHNICSWEHHASDRHTSASLSAGGFSLVVARRFHRYRPFWITFVERSRSCSFTRCGALESTSRQTVSPRSPRRSLSSGRHQMIGSQSPKTLAAHPWAALYPRGRASVLLRVPHLEQPQCPVYATALSPTGFPSSATESRWQLTNMFVSALVRSRLLGPLIALGGAEIS